MDAIAITTMESETKEPLSVEQPTGNENQLTNIRNKINSGIYITIDEGLVLFNHEWKRIRTNDKYVMKRRSTGPNEQPNIRLFYIQPNISAQKKFNSFLCLFKRRLLFFFHM